MRHIRILAALLFVELFSASVVSGKAVDINVVDSKIYVPVEIKGMLHTFILDTGSAGMSIRPSLVEKLKLKVKGERKYAGAARKYKKVKVVSLPELKLAGHMIRNTDVLVLDTGIGESDGIIGLRFLPEYGVLLDFKLMKLDLFKKQKILSHSVPFRMSKNGKPLVSVMINGKTIENFLFDTGTGRTSLTRALAGALSLGDTGRKIRIRDTTGETEKAHVKKSGSFCMGFLCRRRFEIVVAGYHTREKKYPRSGIIGFDFMRGKRFIIDFESHRLFYDYQ